MISSVGFAEEVGAPSDLASGKATDRGGLKMLKMGLPGNIAISAPKPPTARAARRVDPLILKPTTPHIMLIETYGPQRGLDASATEPDSRRGPV